MLWNAKSKDATFQGIWRFSVDWHFTVDLQIGGCGKWQDSANLTIIIWENAAFERIGCHFTINLQITWCGNLHDRAFHARSANERMGPFHALPEIHGTCSLKHCNFSKFLSVRNYTIHSMWLVKNLNFKTATFQFFLSQSHQIQVMLQMKNVFEGTGPIIDDISRCKCQIVS